MARTKRAPKQHWLWPEMRPKPQVKLSWRPRPGYRVPRCAICGKIGATIWHPAFDGKPVHGKCLDENPPKSL